MVMLLHTSKDKSFLTALEKLTDIIVFFQGVIIGFPNRSPTRHTEIIASTNFPTIFAFD
jgi:hypothetical protein